MAMTRSSSGGVAICDVLPVSFMTVFAHVRHIDGQRCSAASDVIASSCAGYIAAAASYWLRHVVDDGGRHRARVAGRRGWSLQCNISTNVMLSAIN